jgi:hypothetical protein
MGQILNLEQWRHGESMAAAGAVDGANSGEQPLSPCPESVLLAWIALLRAMVEFNAELWLAPLGVEVGRPIEFREDTDALRAGGS